MDLRGKALTRLEVAAYRLVRSRGPFLAWSVRSRLGFASSSPSFESLNAEKDGKRKHLEQFLSNINSPHETVQPAHFQSASESIDDDNNDEVNPNISQIKNFMLEGEPFQGLLRRIRRHVRRPDQSLDWAGSGDCPDQDVNEQELQSPAPRSNEVGAHGPQQDTQMIQELEGYGRSSIPPPDNPHNEAYSGPTVNEHRNLVLQVDLDHLEASIENIETVDEVSALTTGTGSLDAHHQATGELMTNAPNHYDDNSRLGPSRFVQSSDPSPPQGREKRGERDSYSLAQSVSLTRSKFP